ncbi:lipolytic enzyme [Ephemerocybe angulata]|uniref:Lipolytic enzyme n=1 Tax=Ephemerocybe angulata TaxID=980116 RepID=A0A8H6IEU3_9AGAR|nr:lipolytic enzyme [Tulosesus angulatus]
MPQLTEPGNLPPSPFNAPNLVFANTTVRQTVRLTLGGELLRIRISNAFGGSDLPITAVSIALPAGGASGVSAIEAGTTQRLTFSGEESVVVPMGSLVVSDPVRLKGGTIKAPTVVTVTIYSKEGQASNSVTSHPGSRTTSWFARGDHVEAADLPQAGAVEGQAEGEAKTGVAHWYWLSAIEVWAAKRATAVVMVGDSITDGRASTDNGNNRWPDLLLNRIVASRRPSLTSLAVINQAAGGNRILNDGLGPNGLARIDRDVLAHSSVSHAVVFIGVNDIGTAATDAATQDALAKRLIWSYKQIIERLHAHDIFAIGATITPFNGPGQGYSDVNREATRQKVNNWIRTGGAFDAVVDFDKVLADPKKPEQLAETYNSGDYLHPNVAAFQAIVDKFPLDLFERRF